MEDIYILGAGGFAKEVFFLIGDINKTNPRFTFKGFIDKAETRTLTIASVSYEIFNESEFLSKGLTGKLCIGIGDPAVLLAIQKNFQQYDFPNLIHPGFTGHEETITMGKGNIITAGCIFTLDIKIGSFNIFNLNSTVGHDSVIGSCNVFNPGVNISGGVVVGDGNLIGTNATILQYVKMGSRSTLGANALLNKDLGDGIVAVGVPARPLQK